jgi:hypothetical protein
MGGAEMGSKHEDSLLMFQDKDGNWVLTPLGVREFGEMDDEIVRLKERISELINMGEDERVDEAKKALRREQERLSLFLEHIREEATERSLDREAIAKELGAEPNRDSIIAHIRALADKNTDLLKARLREAEENYGKVLRNWNDREGQMFREQQARRHETEKLREGLKTALQIIGDSDDPVVQTLWELAE